MDKSEKVKRPLKQMILNNFIGGVSWGVGVFVGGTIVVSILVFVFSKIDLVPLVGDFVAKVTESVVQKNPELVE